jgi:replication initiation and membrane attachment protein DnaB
METKKEEKEIYRDLQSEELEIVDFLNKHFDLKINQVQQNQILKLVDFFPKPVAKVLLNYSLLTNKHVIMSHIQELSSDWKRKNVKTYDQAMELADKDYGIRQAIERNEKELKERDQDIVRNVIIMNSIGCSVEAIGAYVLKRLNLSSKNV